MKRWHVARTQPGMAGVAAREVEKPYGDRDPFPTLLPKADGRAIFGPYLFIEFDQELDFWEPLNGVRGIVHLMPLRLPIPLPLPISFMDDLIRRLSDGSFSPSVAADLVYEYGPREDCRITSGPWEGHSGPFLRKSSGFINLELVLFNRKFEVPIPAHQVKPASPIAA